MHARRQPPTVAANYRPPIPLRAARIPIPPVGLERLTWLGPGFLWMVSAAGSGELLFTPRVGALYGYALVWALLAAVALKWFINREIGRYTVCTGRTLLHGFQTLPGPRGWALWLIVAPQLVVAVTTIAGLAGSAATALVLAFPGDVRLWTIGSVGVSTVLVVVGRYKGVELVATALAGALALASIAAAASVLRDPLAVAAGVRPELPPDVDYGDVLPWLGFMLSGAAGMIWYSYWAQAKGYGAAAGSDQPPRIDDARALTADERQRLRGWLSQMTLDNSIAVVGTLLITLAFLVLGVELLRPQGLVPEEDRVASVLGELLGGVWGRTGFWFMVLAVFIGFWDTVLSNQDGFGRMFGDGLRRLFHMLPWSESQLRNAVVLVFLTAAPVALYLVSGAPVRLLQIAGGIEAAHIPVVAALTLVLNHRQLPEGLRPSTFVVACTAMAALFFAVFALVYVFTL